MPKRKGRSNFQDCRNGGNMFPSHRLPCDCQILHTQGYPLPISSLPRARGASSRRAGMHRTASGSCSKPANPGSVHRNVSKHCKTTLLHFCSANQPFVKGGDWTQVGLSKVEWRQTKGVAGLEGAGPGVGSVTL